MPNWTERLNMLENNIEVSAPTDVKIAEGNESGPGR